MPSQNASRCNCIMAAHCNPTRSGYCRLKAGGTVNAGGGVCSPKTVSQNVADPDISPERRAAMFVINDLKDKLAEMVLHDETENEYDDGYMAAIEEIEVWLNDR